ncbi:cupin domain-containing protein [Vibrio sp. WXL103]|uniref:cupin domain-containing protein n=1 Tax=Vibrio sp. WXL103 TaxID=3450710 RepID=UPI003EC633A3
MNQHITMSLDNHSSYLTSKALPAYTPLDFPGWQGLAIEDNKFFMFVFDIEANAAEFPLHSDENTWLAYVIEGQGTLFAGTKDNQEKTSQTEFKAGDAITFEANTPHAWQVGDKASKILFCRNN